MLGKILKCFLFNPAHIQFFISWMKIKYTYKNWTWWTKMGGLPFYSHVKINLKINPSFYHITRCSALVFMLTQWKQSFDIADNIDFWYCRQSLRAIPEKIATKLKDIVCIDQSWFKITCSMTSHREYSCTITLLKFSLGITQPEMQTLQYLIATATGTKMPQNRSMFLVHCYPKLLQEDPALVRLKLSDLSLFTCLDKLDLGLVKCQVSDWIIYK